MNSVNRVIEERPTGWKRSSHVQEASRRNPTSERLGQAADRALQSHRRERKRGHPLGRLRTGYTASWSLVFGNLRLAARARESSRHCGAASASRRASGRRFERPARLNNRGYTASWSVEIGNLTPPARSPPSPQADGKLRFIFVRHGFAPFAARFSFFTFAHRACAAARAAALRSPADILAALAFPPFEPAAATSIVTILFFTLPA